MNKKALINIKNENDNECFRWCHLAFLFPDKNHPQRIRKYTKYINKIKYDRTDLIARRWVGRQTQ